MSLPVFFILLASATLLAALAALFVSLRAAFGGPDALPVAAGGGTSDRAALEDEKNALLRALKDLEYEHEVGKISDADYERLERAYRARAKQVLAELDRDLGPYLSQAEALIARSLGEHKPAKKGKKKAKTAEPVPEAPPPAPAASETPEPDEPEEQEPDEPSAEPATSALVCAKCETKNDADASFCKRCAAPLAAEASP